MKKLIYFFRFKYRWKLYKYKKAVEQLAINKVDFLFPAGDVKHKK